MAAPWALPNVETITEPYPRATKPVAVVILVQVGVIGMNGSGPTKIKEVAKTILPITDIIVG